jgi:hypothetical protein
MGHYVPNKTAICRLEIPMCTLELLHPNLSEARFWVLG